MPQSLLMISQTYRVKETVHSFYITVPGTSPVQEYSFIDAIFLFFHYSGCYGLFQRHFAFFSNVLKNRVLQLKVLVFEISPEGKQLEQKHNLYVSSK